MLSISVWSSWISALYVESWTAERVAFSIEVSGCLAAHQPDVEVLVSYSHTHGPTALLVVHTDVLLGGFVPPVVAVSLVQYVAVGVPHSSHATWRHKTALGHCWIDIEL